MTEPKPGLGWRPAEGWNVNLGQGNAFLQTLTRSDGTPWPAGATLTIHIKFKGNEIAAWPATMLGADASWAVPAATVNAVLATIGYDVATTTVVYHDNSVDQTWMSGRVEVF